MPYPHSPGRLTLQARADLGRTVHDLISDHATMSMTASPADLRERLSLAATLALGGHSNKRRSVAAHAAHLAHLYFTRYAPTLPWRLLSPEFDTGEGQVDLAWRHEQGWILLDEIKTSGPGVTQLRRKWIKQAFRYTTAAHRRFGGALIGTRLIPLQQPRLTLLIAPDGSRLRLGDIALISCPEEHRHVSPEGR